MSSYRTLEQQKTLYARYMAGTGNLAAKPGTSATTAGVTRSISRPREMRAMVDRIGAPFGWSKTWSDAPSEWWHILYAPGHYSGPDPGPYGQAIAPAPPKEAADVVAVTMPDGRRELFTEIETVGVVLHAWQQEDRALDRLAFAGHAGQLTMVAAMSKITSDKPVVTILTIVAAAVAIVVGGIVTITNPQSLLIPPVHPGHRVPRRCAGPGLGDRARDRQLRAGDRAGPTPPRAPSTAPAARAPSPRRRPTTAEVWTRG